MNGLITPQALSVHLNPLVSTELLIGIGVLGFLVLGLYALHLRQTITLRALAFVGFIMMLLNPSLHEEKRESVPGIVAVISDESISQSFGQRAQRTQDALEHLRGALSRFESIEPRYVSGPVNAGRSERTALFEVLQNAFEDVPESRRAGAILITDGQVHDVPEIETLQDMFGPVHVLLSGERNETDRRIVLSNAPAFGIVGQSIAVTFKIEDSGQTTEDIATVTLQMSDGTRRTERVQVGEEHTINLPVEHAGQNVFELSVDALPDELTVRNNSVAIDFQGVRDRLRVLLVSGKPHAGARTWRDLLTADPSVDLVHFTILREPDKIDSTPQSEMSLIAFPFRELFELKLYDFDLIIFDRYRLNRILPDHYFRNIARYVEEGGAFLEASGPAYAGEDSVYYTALRDILPGAPTGEIINQSFVPKISERGLSHPVTSSLGERQLIAHNSIRESQAPWGAWSRQIGLQNTRGDTVMEGANNQPLLLLNRVEEGRTAHIASDHIWLWSRGFDSGGPHAELLRRIVHWLVKEPELDEEALGVLVDNRTLIIRRSAFDRETDTITMTQPDGAQEEITLNAKQGAMLEHILRAEQIGIYRFETQDEQVRFAVVGDANAPEFQNILTSEEPLTPLAEKTSGSVSWLSDNNAPRVRLVKGGRFAGNGWIALQDHRAYIVTGALEKPLLPLWASLLGLLTLIIGAWFYEGRKS